MTADRNSSPAEAEMMQDRLPQGHTVLEQADMLDSMGRVSQTVRIDATGEEYERIVHFEEAYGPEEDEDGEAIALTAAPKTTEAPGLREALEKAEAERDLALYALNHFDFATAGLSYPSDGVAICTGLNQEALAAAKRLRDKGLVTITDSGAGPMIRWADRRGAALSDTPQPVAVPDDVRALVIAARHVAFDDTPSREALDELDKASEAFAERIPWDDEPDDEDSQQENTP